MSNFISRVKRCRAALIHSAPIVAYFAEELILLGTDELEGTGVTTAGVSQSGVTVFHEPFVATLSDRELMFVIAHEALHWGLAIFDRSENLDKLRTNIAHDHVVNLLLQEIATLDMPQGGLCSKKYSGLSFEQVYKELTFQDQASQKRKKSGKGTSTTESMTTGIGQDLDFSGHIDTLYSTSIEYPVRDFKHDAQRRLTDVVEKIQEEDRRNGGVQGSLLHRLAAAAFTIQGVSEAPQKLFDILPSFIGRYGRREMPSKKRRHRRNRFDGTHIPYAGLRPMRSKLYLLIDTSGSMRYEIDIMKKLFGFILRLVDEFDLKLEIIQADTAVREVSDGYQFIEQILSGEVGLLGGGGSDFCSAIEFAIEDAAHYNEGNLPLIALTDGYIKVPKKITGVRADIVWAGPHGTTAPTEKYGTHVII